MDGYKNYKITPNPVMNKGKNPEKREKIQRNTQTIIK